MARRTKMSDIEKAYKYCENVTKLHAKSFYFAARFLPEHKRKAVFPIYAFCRQVDDEIDEIGCGGDERKAIETIEEWQQELEVVFEGKRQAKSKIEDQTPKTKDRNLVFQAWEDLLQNYKIPQNLPLELIKGVLMDTHMKRYETFDEL